MSLQSKEPLSGHPNTLRDLTHVTEVLMLPAAFGAIQLGETFSGCIAVNNDTSSWEVEGVTLRVEMQSTTAKVVLAEVGGPEHRLDAMDTMEGVVHYEIKELGQHVLACTVSYHLPESMRQERQAEQLQTFRKFYKFQVRHPSTILSTLFIFIDAFRYVSGHEPAICQDQSPYPSLSFRTSVILGTGESVPGAPCPKPHSGVNVVVEDRV